MTEKIEELELVTEELEKNKNLLVEAERYATIGYISAQLVHAIRNPITSIGGTARLLLKKTGDAKTRRFLKIMAQETSKIEDTLVNLFEFVDDMDLEIQRNSISQILVESIASFYPTLQQNSIELTHNADETDLYLEIDPQKIRQVFHHLIRNSIEAMPSGGRLEITITGNNDGIIVTIADSGHGIASTDFNVLSDPFYTTKTYGTGLGLTLVERILELHGAEFSLTPNASSGTTASVRFPLSNPRTRT